MISRVIHKTARLCRIPAAAIALGTLLAACAPVPEPGEKAERAALYEPARFADLTGWQADDHGAALAALLRSCPALELRGTDQFGGATDWQAICVEARRLPENDDGAARAFFERRFTPVRVTDGDGDPGGLFTGYYEPELRGARAPDKTYAVPLHLRPPELVSVDLGRFRDELKGSQIAGRVVQGTLIPYYERRRIEDGALTGRNLELVWVDSAADAFFLHIQGSGRVRLRDGTVLRVGYAGSNGHPYTAIGRLLVERGEIARDEMSMQAIRAWLEAHPDEGAQLMRANRSYVFFREITGPGPIGAQGVALTPGRSLAVDRRWIPLGLPVWLDTALPGEPARPLRRLMIAQDTGGAIKGAVRGDVFWGAGAAAAERAGRMKSPGRYWLLRPRSGGGTS